MARMEKQGRGGGRQTQEEKDLLKNFLTYKKALNKKYPQNGGMTPIDNKEYVI